MTDTRVFKSKIDVWLGALLGLQLTAFVAVAGGLLFVNAGRIGIVLAVILLAAACLIASTIAWTSYTLDETQLTIRSGPFRWRIPLGHITGVTPVRALTSGPALSLDRLQIDYSPDKAILISPADQQGFLAEFEARRRSLQDF
jgi:hypothetical protein